MSKALRKYCFSYCYGYGRSLLAELLWRGFCKSQSLFYITLSPTLSSKPDMFRLGLEKLRILCHNAQLLRTDNTSNIIGADMKSPKDNSFTIFPAAPCMAVVCACATPRHAIASAKTTIAARGGSARVHSSKRGSPRRSSQ